MIDGKLKYVDAKGYFVGRFSETDLANGIDKTAVNQDEVLLPDCMEGVLIVRDPERRRYPH